MNPYSLVNPYYKQENKAKDHWENIIYALTILTEATTGEITKFVNDRVKGKVTEKYNATKYLSEPDQEKVKEWKRVEMEEKQVSKKTVQNWLKRLEKKGLVSKTKYFVYRLTAEGYDKKIFGEYYGKIVYDRLMEMPLKGSDEEKLLEYVKRLGIYITYIFVRNSARSGIRSQYSAVRTEDDEWINDSISPVLLFEWFNNVFYSKSKLQNYGKLIKTLSIHFSEYIHNLEESDKRYYEEVFPHLQKQSQDRQERNKKNLDYS